VSQRRRRGLTAVDHRSLHCGEAKHGEQRAHWAAGLEAAVGEQTVVADGYPNAGDEVADRQNHKILPVKRSSPRDLDRDAKENGRHNSHNDVREVIYRLVLEDQRVIASGLVRHESSPLRAKGSRLPTVTVSRREGL
jgi:hypothetical protein